METSLVRLKPHDPRRGHVLRRFSYRGIKFHEERGWYRVEKAVGDYLGGVHQVAGDEHSSLAFDVCTAQEALALDARDHEAGAVRKSAADDIRVSVARAEGAVTTEDLPDEAGERASSRRGRRG